MTEIETPPAERHRRRRRHGQAERTRADAGFALVWFALTLVVLLAMAGAAVDLWNWYYNGNEQQRAADAAALSGVVFLPSDPAAARAAATDIAIANDVPASQLTIETTADDPTLDANQLRVTVRRRVETSFLKLIGVDSANVSRDAVAEYTSRLPMGSPEQNLGRDPELNKDNGYWLSVSSRADTKVGGDRYQNYPCGESQVYGCTSGNSDEYSESGYTFAVELQGPPTGDLVLEAYDPAHTETDAQDCTNTGRLPTSGSAGYGSNINAIKTRFPGDTRADARYAPGDTIYCNGDIGSNNSNGTSSTANVTTFIVREPDTTQSNDLDNPPYSGTQVNQGHADNGVCTRQFRGVNLRPYGSTRTIYQILAGNAGGTTTQNNTAATAAHAVYRQWVPLCRIPAATVTQWYNAGTRSVILQVRSNAELGSPFTAGTASRNGRNHFALRAGYGTGSTPSSVTIYAQGRLPIHNGADGDSTTEFFLTRVPPGNAGRTLALDFYDVADASGTVDFQIVPPTGFGGTFSDCTFRRLERDKVDVGLGGATATGCKLSGMTNSRYNGRVTEVRVKVPSTYTCVLSNPNDCWIKVRVTYRAGSGNVYDHTVWDAGVVGEPVRLVE